MCVSACDQPEGGKWRLRKCESHCGNKKPQKAQEVSDLHVGTCGKVKIAQEVENIEHSLQHELLIKVDYYYQRPA